MSHQSDRALRVLASSNQLSVEACCAFHREIAAARKALDRSRSNTLDLHEARKQIKRARAALRLLRRAAPAQKAAGEGDRTWRAAVSSYS